MNKLPIVVLISGSGTNLQAIIDASKQDLAVEIRAVISNQADAFGLQRAEQADITTHTIAHRDFATRDEFDQALMSCIDSYRPELVVLAGFMRRLGSDFVSHYAGRMINIHPSLLPKHPGLNTHKRVLETGDTQHGVSIHFVTDEVDCGPIICQAKLEVLPADTEESLKQRAHALEHQIYPEVLRWFAAGRLRTENGYVLFDNEKISKNGKILLN